MNVILPVVDYCMRASIVVHYMADFDPVLDPDLDPDPDPGPDLVPVPVPDLVPHQLLKILLGHQAQDRQGVLRSPCSE